MQDSYVGVGRQPSNVPNKFKIVHWNDKNKDIECEMLIREDNSFEWVGVPPEFKLMMELRFND